MKETTVFVLSEPTNPQLRLLEDLPANIRVLVGESAKAALPEAESIEAVLAWSGSIGGAKGDIPELLRILPNLKWIHTRWAGMDSMLFPELVSSDIVVTNARGVFADSLAEFVLTSILYFAKDIPRMKRNQAKKNWEMFDVEVISGKTLGVFGYGEIGKACAKKAAALGMKILASRRHPHKSKSDEIINRFYAPNELKDLCAASDYLVVSAPLTPETKQIFNDELFSSFAPHSVFINIGRGAVVDEPALCRALEQNKIRGAALDVFAVEPLPADSPLWTMENVLLSPHTADHTDTWLDDAMQCFVSNAIRFAKDEQLENIVDKKLGY